MMNMKGKVPSEKLPISLCIIVLNEAERLERCFEHISKIVDEILLLDTGSTDTTIQTAQDLGAVIYQYQWDGNFSNARNFLMEKARNDWVLWIDGDEYYPPELVEEIRQYITADEGFNGYYFPRRNYYLGRWLRYGGNYPDYQLKLYKKSTCSPHRNRVHEKVIVRGKTAYCKHWCEHHSYPTVNEYLEKFKRYTDLEAQRLKDEGEKITVLNTARWLFLKPCWRFVKRYFFKGGFLNGVPGFFAAFFDSVGYVVRYIKLWQMNRLPR